MCEYLCVCLFRDQSFTYQFLHDPLEMLIGIVRTVKDGEDVSMIPRVKALVERFLSKFILC